MTFESALGSSFVLVQVEARIDGEGVLECDAGEGRFDTTSAVLVHDGPLPSGEHLLEVDLRYRGNGHGIFAYLRGYTFNVRSEHTFVAPIEGAAHVHVRAHERGDSTTALEDRPAISFLAEGPAPEPLPRGCPRQLPLDP